MNDLASTLAEIETRAIPFTDATVTPQSIYDVPRLVAAVRYLLRYAVGDGDDRSSDYLEIEKALVPILRGEKS